MMAEVTSAKTATPCSTPGGETKTKDTDPFKSVGSLAFRIDNFCEFSKSSPGKKTSMRHCDTKVSIRGLTFGLAVYPCRCMKKNDSEQKCMSMGVIVNCENVNGCNVEGDGSWSCLTFLTMRIKTLLDTRKDELYETTHRFFSSKEESSLEWDDEPFRFDFLCNPKNGLYNEENDTLELIVEISADSPAGVIEMLKTCAIQVNNETMVTDKILLAMNSLYFHSMFYNEKFDEGKSGVYKVNIEAPATVEHFKRMLQTMYPMNKPLDDECIEGVLHVANQFLVTDVEGKCLEFLREESTKPALFKYRMADKYGCTALKKYVLRNLKTTDFEKDLFKTNMAECVQLGPDAAEAFMARYDELFTPKTEKKLAAPSLI